MKPLSRPVAERLGRWAATSVLVLGAIPIALPLLWLALSSLKTADTVLAAEPEWLPTVDRYTVDDGGRVRPVTVLDRGRDRTLGWWRVRPAGDEDPTCFFWPAEDIETRVITGYVAPIGLLKRAVTTPSPPDAQGNVIVGQLGTQRTASVDPAEVRTETAIEHVVNLLGQEVQVAWESPGGAPASPVFRVTRPSAPFYLATDRLTGSAEAPSVSVDATAHLEVPVEVLAHLPVARVSRVRFTPAGPVRTTGPAVKIERRVVVRHYVRRDNRDVEVKPTRCDDRGHPLEVAFPGELRTWTRPAVRVTTAARSEQRIRWLSQSLTVLPRPDIAAPAGLVALQTTAPDDAAVVAAHLVRRQKHSAPQWSNYVNVFNVEPLYRHVLNTLFITALCIVGNVLSCGLVGYAFARLSFRGRDALFVVVLATMMLPSTITFLPTYILYTKIGWLDSFYPLIVPAFLATSAFFIFLYRQFFLTIPLDLEDAARIDGCGPLATFWHILLPLARPAVVTVAVFTFLGAWNDFMGPLLYLNTDEYQTLAYGLYAFKTSFFYKFPNYMMAASVMMMVPTLVIYFFAQAAFLRGIVVTGVKG